MSLGLDWPSIFPPDKRPARRSERIRKEEGGCFVLSMIPGYSCTKAPPFRALLVYISRRNKQLPLHKIRCQKETKRSPVLPDVCYGVVKHPEDEDDRDVGSSKQHDEERQGQSGRRRPLEPWVQSSLPPQGDTIPPQKSTTVIRDSHIRFPKKSRRRKNCASRRNAYQLRHCKGVQLTLTTQPTPRNAANLCRKPPMDA